jgi:hypothetical protein
MKAWKFVLILYAIAAIFFLVNTGHCQDIQVHQFARAVARAEGFYVPRSIPNRLHNPGDLMTHKIVYPGQVGVYHNYAVFRTDTAGWSALENQIRKVIEGTSSFYRQDMTMLQIARVYATNWQNWSKIVCKILQVSPRLTFAEYFNLAPRVNMAVNYGTQMWMFDGRAPNMPILQSVPKMPTYLYGEGRWLVL